MKPAGFLTCCLLLSVMAGSLLISGCAGEQRRKVSCGLKYEPTWESLKQYKAPEWYKDAKFGIFIHWGVYAVPAFQNEWYPRSMYLKGNDAYQHHKNTWGGQLEFGYKDFIPMFKAENWEPEAWAKLFKQSGAKYVVPVAEHHDGFAMYESSHTKWNSVQMGPHRDIVGELAEAVRKHGMKFGTSTHYAHNWFYYPHSNEFDTNDPRYFGLYGKGHSPKEAASKEFIEDWYARTTDIVDKYQPDILYFDFGFNRSEFESFRKKIAAYYYNKGLEWNKGVVLNYKNKAFPEGAAVLDVERGKLAGIRDMVWQTDTSISYRSWGYIEDDDFKTVNKLVDDLVDIVSKNGVLLLNVGPKADGTIPDEAKDIFLGIGKWLEVNGEAIYGTRPWLIFGEGPTEVEKGSFTDNTKDALTAQDIRFTTKANVLYAICMDWPEKQVSIKSLGKKSMPGIEISEVRMLGAEEKLKWVQDWEGLTISLPSKKPCENAYVFKIALGGCGFGGLRAAQDGTTVTVSVIVENYEKSAWSGDFDLYVDGKAVANRKVSVRPQTKEKVAFAYELPEAGIYKVAVGSGDNVVPAKTVAVPGISLAGVWRFHKGNDSAWKNPELDDSNWELVELPASWENHSNYNEDPASGWYRKTITIPHQWKGHELVLCLEKIDDVDETYFNGRMIGGMGHFPPEYETAWNKVRKYSVSPELIHYDQENVIAIRVYDGGGGGGLYAGPLGPVEIADEP